MRKEALVSIWLHDITDQCAVNVRVILLLSVVPPQHGVECYTHTILLRMILLSVLSCIVSKCFKLM